MTLDTSFLEDIRFFEAKPHRPLDDVTYLLLHGLGNSLDFWLEVAPVLGVARRSIAIDIPGFGGSRIPVDGFTLASVSSAISKFCRSLNINNCVLVAHSMGAFVALQVMAHEPARFRKLILVDGTLSRVINLIRYPQRILGERELGIYVSAQFLGGIVPFNRWTAKIVYSTVARDLTLWPYIAHPSQADPSVLSSALTDNGGLTVVKALAEARRVDYVQLMRDLLHPVDLVWGAEDHLINREDVDQARKYMTVDREMEIQSCGHWPMIEAPKKLTSFIMGCEQAIVTV